jgi:hypothetical protein
VQKLETRKTAAITAPNLLFEQDGGALTLIAESDAQSINVVAPGNN